MQKSLDDRPLNKDAPISRQKIRSLDVYKIPVGNALGVVTIILFIHPVFDVAKALAGNFSAKAESS